MRPITTVHQAKLRLARAIDTVSEQLLDADTVDHETVIGSITRIVIATNSLAELLWHAEGDTRVQKEAADLLWQLGEGLAINGDHSRFES